MQARLIESYMCDINGIVYAGDGGQSVVNLGGFDQFATDDLDEQTKRELLATGFGSPFVKLPDPKCGWPTVKLPDPKCRWCRGTGRVKLLISETECDCVR